MQTPPSELTPDSLTQKKGVRKDISMLMFLLAAETAVVSTTIQREGPNTLLASGPVTTTAKIAYSDTSSNSPGETDSSSESINQATEHDLLDMMDSAKVIEMSETVVSSTIGYLTWKDAVKLRGVNKAWMRAVAHQVQLRTLPGTDRVAAFLPCPSWLEADTACEQRLQFLHPSTWRCVVCGFWNAETRVLCGNRQCQSPSLTHTGCSRIFLGQLRRDATVPFLQWLISQVADPSELRNVENHRHNVTNRGKGCAWAYFNSEDAAREVLRYHRRMFLDCVDGIEGLWIVKPTDVDVLQEVATERGYSSQRPKYLPRNALVIETPATGGSAACDPILSKYAVDCQYVDAPESFFPRDAIEPPQQTVTPASYRHDPYRYNPLGLYCEGSAGDEPPAYDATHLLTSEAFGYPGDFEMYSYDGYFYPY